MIVRKMRLLRRKYGITCEELGLACGLSPQRISEIEMNAEGLTSQTFAKIMQGFETVVCRRRERLLMLCEDMNRHEHTLLEPVEETTYEL